MIRGQYGEIRPPGIPAFRDIVHVLGLEEEGEHRAPRLRKFAHGPIPRARWALPSFESLSNPPRFLAHPLFWAGMPARRDPGLPIVAPDVVEYIDALANRGDEALKAVEDQGEREGWPIVGAAEGSLLHALAKAIGAKRILELGAAIGYSGTWLARALPEDGQLITMEGNAKTAKIAAANFAKTGVASRVTILVGAAQELIQDLEGSFDVIFNDIDKEGYPDVLDPCIRRLRVGGLLLTDNVLWHGEVARKSRSAETRAIREYNERLSKDPRMVATIVPLRDGVSVALKVHE